MARSIRAEKISTAEIHRPLLSPSKSNTLARTMKTKRTASKPSAKKAATKKGATLTNDALRAELTQLDEIRAKFTALPRAQSAAFYALYSDEQCRDHGENTKASDTFRGAMSWARTLAEHRSDAAIAPARARWFLDCLTALGHALSGKSSSGNPAHAAELADAEKLATKLTQRTVRRLRDAIGANASHLAALEAALAHDGVGSKESSQCRKLAALCKRWLAANEGAPPVALFDVTDATVSALEAASAALDSLIATTPAARAMDRDSPAINAAEGRLLYAMRTLWNDAAEAREDGTSTLVFTVNPAILRGLNLASRNRRAPAPETKS